MPVLDATGYMFGLPSGFVRLFLTCSIVFIDRDNYLIYSLRPGNKINITEITYNPVAM